MKVSELFTDAAVSVKEQLKKVDWNYDHDLENDRRFKRGKELMETVERSVFTLWKQQPEQALRLWEEHCPWAKQNQVPMFILRLNAQEKVKVRT